jgi:phenylpropionate dioxygenase-like ring-hydroxylating dioxygenase large terminal subunit
MKLPESAAELFAKFEETRRPVNSARHVPGFVYTSPEIFALEKEKIFMKDWLCVGRVEEIENPGDYLALHVLGEPVLLTRGSDGAVNAFSNICLHRGVEVATGSGNRRSFTCPFHGWTYNLEGRLVGAPLMKEAEGFDPAACRLSPIRTEVWKSWIFLTFDADAPPLAQHVAPLERDFGYLEQENCRLAIKSVNDVDCNWKLVVENLVDFYHVNIVHKSTNGRIFTRNAYKLTPRERGGYVAEYNSGPSTPTGKPVFGKMPSLQDKPDDFATGGLLAPNFTFFGRIDDVHPYVTWPLSPSKTRVIVYTLLPKVYFDDPDFETKVVAYREFQNRVIAEDKPMLESMQANMSSRHYRPGRMASIEEGVHHVLNGYLDRMSSAG